MADPLGSAEARELAVGDSAAAMLARSRLPTEGMFACCRDCQADATITAAERTRTVMLTISTTNAGRGRFTN